jgi:hypothetical protein
VTITTIAESKAITLKLNSASASSIIPVFSSAAFSTGYQILSQNIFIKNLKAYAKIASLDPINLPNFELEDTETDKLYKTLDVEWGSPRKQLNLYISNTDPVDWNLIGSISLLNPSGYPYRMYNLMDLYTDNLAIELGDNGQIGVQIQDVGYGLLTGSDLVTIHGSRLREIVVEDNPAPITGNTPFGQTIGTSSTVVLSANSSRKYALFVNESFSKVYLNFGETASLGQGIPIFPGGGTYELYIKDTPYYGAISAIATADNTTLTGTESV